MKELFLKKWMLRSFIVLILVFMHASIIYPITGTPGGYQNDPFADAVFDYHVYPPPEIGGGDLNWVLGAPNSPKCKPPHQFPYVHLGNGGYITVQFTDNRIYNGPGDDFRVVEEGLTAPPDEPAIVSVSQDGRSFYEAGRIVPGDWRSIYFDLDALGLDWILYVKVMDNTTTGDGFDLDAVEALNSQKARTVSVDVKPQSCPNLLNAKSPGVLPVAILGTEDFDVTRIRPWSVRLEGVPPIHSRVEDVGESFEDSRDICACDHDVDDDDDGDGYPDLILKFGTQDVITALKAVTSGQDRVLRIIGEITDGTEIQGMDCVAILAEGYGNVKVDNGRLTRLDFLDPSTIADSKNRPAVLIGDLIDMEIEVDPPGATATVTVVLSSPAPVDYEWYKYSPTNGWSDYSANAQFTTTRDEVTLTLVDGGVGDDDGLANGVIWDPSGLGTATVPIPGPGTGGVGSGSSGGGCFMAIGGFGSFIP